MTTTRLVREAFSTNPASVSPRPPRLHQRTVSGMTDRNRAERNCSLAPSVAGLAPALAVDIARNKCAGSFTNRGYLSVNIIQLYHTIACRVGCGKYGVIPKTRPVSFNIGFEGGWRLQKQVSGYSSGAGPILESITPVVPRSWRASGNRQLEAVNSTQQPDRIRR